MMNSHSEISCPHQQLDHTVQSQLAFHHVLNFEMCSLNICFILFCQLSIPPVQRKIYSRNEKLREVQTKSNRSIFNLVAECTSFGKNAKDCLQNACLSDNILLAWRKKQRFPLNSATRVHVGPSDEVLRAPPTTPLNPRIPTQRQSLLPLSNCLSACPLKALV